MKKFCALLLLLTLLPIAFADDADAWQVGYASQELVYGELVEYYISGYRNGYHPTGILDAQRVTAVWLEANDASALLISVDCIGLDSGTICQIRTELADLTAGTGCVLHVVSTHTHAGVDTLGLWGPVGINGKNADFMSQIVEASAQAARAAYADRTAGTLRFSATPTDGMQRDSREPAVYDPNLYQFRFVPDSGEPGVRIISFAAHAEALRGKNTLISRDFPGAMADIILETTGDRTMFLPGAIGGLIMTPEFSSTDLVANMQETGRRLANYALHPTAERPLAPTLSMAAATVRTSLNNTLFICYKFLGILGSDAVRNPLGGYTLRTQVSAMKLGDVTLALLPGEIFPELIADYPDNVLFIGLADDEIGYIVPESDFLLDETAPYVTAAKGHYEETNSVGPKCAADILAALEIALTNLP